MKRMIWRTALGSAWTLMVAAVSLILPAAPAQANDGSCLQTCTPTANCGMSCFLYTASASVPMTCGQYGGNDPQYCAKWLAWTDMSEELKGFWTSAGGGHYDAWWETDLHSQRRQWSTDASMVETRTICTMRATNYDPSDGCYWINLDFPGMCNQIACWNLGYPQD
jgi:hypothetical protein